MELDELKTIWSHHNESLSNHLKINKMILQKVNFATSKKELETPLQYELANTVAFILLLLVFSILTTIYKEDQVIVISGITLIVICLFGLYFNWRKLQAFYKIDYYNTSVTQVQTQIAELKLNILHSRKYDFILIPLMIVPSLTILLKVIHGIDIFEDLYFSMTVLGIAIILTYIGTYFVNKFVYDKKVKNVERLLKEIEDFKQES